MVLWLRLCLAVPGSWGSILGLRTKTPPAEGQRSPQATTTEPRCLSPRTACCRSRDPCRCTTADPGQAKMSIKRKTMLKWQSRGLCMRVKPLSRVRLCDPLGCSPPGSSVHGDSQQGCWSGLPCPPPGGLSDSGITPASPESPALAGCFCTTRDTQEAHQEFCLTLMNEDGIFEKSLAASRAFKIILWLKKLFNIAVISISQPELHS